MGLLNKISDALGIEDDSEKGLTFKPNTKGDKVIWSIVAILVIISLMVVYSSTGSLAYKQNKGNTEYYLFKQIVFIAVGVAVIYFTHLIDYKWFSKVSLWMYIISIPLLIYTLKFGTNLNEANRWIMLPIVKITFQTSDFARLALFMYLARQLSRKQEAITDLYKGYLPLIFPIFLTCGLIAPANLSTALLTGATGILVLFLGRARIKHILGTASVAIIPIGMLVVYALATYNPNVNFDQQIAASANTNQGIKSAGRIGTWVKRIQDFKYAEGDAIPYQVQQAKIAVAKGGWFGLGPGKSEQRNFLPHSYSDYIYPIIIEEYGIFGGLVIVVLYMTFLYRSIRLFRRAPKAFGAFLALALSITLAIQAIANMGVAVGLLPVTGVTLPLISMGGTSFLFTCFSIGIILSVARSVEDNTIKDIDDKPVANAAA